MEVHVSFDEVEDVQRRWKKASRAIGKVCQGATRATLGRGKDLVKSVAPDKSGGLRKSVKEEVTSSDALGAEGEIFADAPHAAPVILGARPHEIRGNPLAFEAGGEQVFTRRVRHPGNAPNPFADKVAPMIEADLENRVLGGVAQVVSEFGG